MFKSVTDDRTYAEVTCLKCKTKFTKRIDHLIGIGQGCTYCSEKQRISNIAEDRKTNEYYIQVKQEWEQYYDSWRALGYSISEFKTVHEYVNSVCPIHGASEIRARFKSACKECGYWLNKFHYIKESSELELTHSDVHLALVWMREQGVDILEKGLPRVELLREWLYETERLK